MSLTTLNALSPLDGRYQTKLDALRPYFSEYALIKHRAWVEIEWLKALSAAPELAEIATFSVATVKELDAAIANFSEADAAEVKTIEARPNPDVVLLIISPKLEQHAASQKVVAQFDAQGIVCALWPLERQQLPAWFTRRLSDAGLSTSKEGLACLVDYTEGNLLAAAQAIDLLALLYPHQAIRAEQIEQSLVKQAKFDVFSLGEAFLNNDSKRYNQMLLALKAEGVEPVLVLWAIVKELRLLLQLSHLQQAGQSLQAVWPTLGIWDKRRPLYQAALQTKRDWPALMIKAAECDVVLKGYGQGDAWLLFSRLLSG